MPGGQSIFYNAASKDSRMIGNKLTPQEGVSFSVADHMVRLTVTSHFLTPSSLLGACVGSARRDRQESLDQSW
jgi:hypothetical protein